MRRIRFYYGFQKGTGQVLETKNCQVYGSRALREVSWIVVAQSQYRFNGPVGFYPCNRLSKKKKQMSSKTLL